MVATSRHHGLPALPDAKAGLQGAFFNLWTPDPRHRHQQPNTTHLDPIPPQEAPAVAWDLSNWDFPSVDQVLWVRKGVVGRVGLWEWGAAQALFADAPESVPAGPPTCPFHPTFLSRSAPSSDLAVIEVAEQCMLFFVGSVRQMEICKGDIATLMRSRRSTSPCRVLLPRCGRPRCGILSSQPQRGGRPDDRRLGHSQSHAHVIARCACLCVCFLYWQIGRNSREIRTNFVRISRE